MDERNGAKVSERVFGNEEKKKEEEEKKGHDEEEEKKSPVGDCFFFLFLDNFELSASP